MISIQCPVNHLVELVFHLGRLAIANCLDEQIFQGFVFEGFTKNIEDLAAQRLFFDFQLVEQLLKYIAFPGFIGDQIPQMADFGLSNSMNAAKALFQPVGVPGQVVIDHKAGVLQVHAFTGSIGRHQYQHVWVVAELFLRFAPGVAVGTAMNGYDGAGVTQ